MNIELLYFDGCPNYKPAMTLLKEVLQEEGITAEITEINVAEYKDVDNLKFPGSPTIMVNGKDVEPSSEEKSEFVMNCRIYNVKGIPLGLPSKDMIREAISNV